MFDIGWSELLVIGVVALIAIGPKELPGVLRTVGVWMGKVRRMASEFQGQFQEAMREAEMADLKKQVDDVTSAAQNITNYDPLEDVRKEVENVHDDLTGALEQKPAETAPEPTTTEPTTTEPVADVPPPVLAPEPASATAGQAPPPAPAKPAAERS